MKKYEIYTTDEFDSDFEKLDGSLKERVRKAINQLEINPYVGKPLGFKFFREKKVGNYRFYYLIYEEHIVVFLVAIGDKKDQQEVIDTIKRLIPFYREEIKKKLGL